MGLTAVFFTPILEYLPLAVLAALIIVACFSLCDFKGLVRTYRYSNADGITAIATLFAVLFLSFRFLSAHCPLNISKLT